MSLLGGNGPHFMHDDRLLQLHPLYERQLIKDSTRIELVDLEVDSTGSLLAVVEADGVISIWQRQEQQWNRQSSWRYRSNRRPHYLNPFSEHKDNSVNEPFRSGLRPHLILRWAHERHGRYLAVAADNKRKVHVFGENEQDKLQQSAHINMKRVDPLIRWHRKHSMVSAGNVTEMQFCPPHMEMELATATHNGVVVIHAPDNRRDITSWRPLLAIQVFPQTQPINSLTWNQNPIHELAILIASTNSVQAPSDQRIAIFPRKNDPVTAEQNMHFDMDNHVTCVAFGPSNGLNESILAIGVGRRIFLHTFLITEAPVEDAEGGAHLSSQPPEFVNESERATSAAISVDDRRQQRNMAQSQPNMPGKPVQKLKKDHSSASPRQTGGHMGKNLIVGSVTSVESDASPILPPQFFDGSVKETSVLEESADRFKSQHVHPEQLLHEDDQDPPNGPVEELRGHFDEGFEETTDEEEELDADLFKLLKWEFPRIAVFRETSAVRRVRWNVNPDGFTAEFCDGKLRSYKCKSWPCVLTPSHFQGDSAAFGSKAQNSS